MKGTQERYTSVIVDLQQELLRTKMIMIIPEASLISGNDFPVSWKKERALHKLSKHMLIYFSVLVKYLFFK